MCPGTVSGTLALRADRGRSVLFARRPGPQYGPWWRESAPAGTRGAEAWRLSPRLRAALPAGAGAGGGPGGSDPGAAGRLGRDPGGGGQPRRPTTSPSGRATWTAGAWFPDTCPRTTRRRCGLLDQLGAALQQLAGGARIPLIYGSDAQLELLYRHRAALERRFLFLLNQDDLGWALNDKGHFLALCQKAGVPVPRTLIPAFDRNGATALRAIWNRADPPLVVKPRTKSDWKDIQQALFQSKAKARVFPDAGSLLAHPGFAGVRDRLVVQEYIEAPVTNLRSFHGFADAAASCWPGSAATSCTPTRRSPARARCWNWTTTCEVEEVGKETADRLELRGTVQAGSDPRPARRPAVRAGGQRPLQPVAPPGRGPRGEPARGGLRLPAARAHARCARRSTSRGCAGRICTAT